MIFRTCQLFVMFDKSHHLSRWCVTLCEKRGKSSPHCPRLDLRAPNTSVLNIAVVSQLSLPLTGNERQQSVKLQYFTIGFLYQELLSLVDEIFKVWKLVSGKNSFQRNTENNSHENFLLLEFVVPFSRMLVAQLQCSHNRECFVLKKELFNHVSSFHSMFQNIFVITVQLLYKLSVVIYFTREKTVNIYIQLHVKYQQ